MKRYFVDSKGWTYYEEVTKHARASSLPADTSDLTEVTYEAYLAQNAKNKASVDPIVEAEQRKQRGIFQAQLRDVYLEALQLGLSERSARMLTGYTGD